jgi:hypothetical protein
MKDILSMTLELRTLEFKSSKVTSLF